MPAGPDYPAKLRELHGLISSAIDPLPGIWRGIPVSGRMRDCFGRQSRCGSPYCPSCSQGSFFKMEQALRRSVSRVNASRLWFATFTAADCSDDALRFTVKEVAGAGVRMLKGIRSLNGWFLRQEVSRYDSGVYHAHLHAVLDTKRGYRSGRNTMSITKWEEAWRVSLPVDLHTVQVAPVDIQRVTDVEGIVRYLCKSPWSDAVGESDEETIDSVVEICSQLQRTTGLRRYASAGSLSISLHRPTFTSSTGLGPIFRG
jgi:hypothetical protein